MVGTLVKETERNGSGTVSILQFLILGVVVAYWDYANEAREENPGAQACQNYSPHGWTSQEAGANANSNTETVA